jgi:DNA-binding MarR family transcriptional regulator
MTSDDGVHGGLEKFISLGVTRLAKRIERHAETYLQEVAQIGVDEWRVMAHVYRLGHTGPEQIAAEMNIDGAHLRRIARDLAHKFFLGVSDGPDGFVITPTAVGAGMVDTIMPHMARRQKLFACVLDGSEIEALQKLIGKLTVHLDMLLLEQDRRRATQERQTWEEFDPGHGI